MNHSFDIAFALISSTEITEWNEFCFDCSFSVSADMNESYISFVLSENIFTLTVTLTFQCFTHVKLLDSIVAAYKTNGTD